MNGQTEITERRTLDLNRLAGRVDLTVNVFGGDQRYMLVTTGPGIQFQAHFNAAEWAEFQKLVSP